MSGKWQRTFEVSVPVERVWEAFTRINPPPAGARPDPNASVKPQIIEFQPMKLLRWSAEGGQLPERSEITVVFESTATGSRFTVTRFGFGEGEDADVFSESNGLGWEGGLMDIVFELETGVAVNRHYYGAYDACTGVMYAQRDWGLEVLKVLPGTFGAEAGLMRGDRLVRLDGAAVFSRANVWTLLEARAPGDNLSVEFVRGRALLRGSGRLSSQRSAGMGAVGE
jgi:membrane-associated protease RseP (regulator of RpoE activity)